MEGTNCGELAESFVRYFCGGDLAGLASVVAEELQFQGPLLNCTSRSEYLSALSGDLEPDPNFIVEAIISNGNQAAAFYRYRGQSIAQYFMCERGEIIETKVVFGSAVAA